MSTHNEVLNLCKAGSAAWKAAFNGQDAAACAAQYSDMAVMEAKPFGTYVGREEIQAFWQKIIDDGFADVAYQEENWQAKGEDAYVLSAQWRMNKAYGVVHYEHWKVQADGRAYLVRDEFEVLGER